jgi:hypothetical protein
MNNLALRIGTCFKHTKRLICNCIQQIASPCTNRFSVQHVDALRQVQSVLSQAFTRSSGAKCRSMAPPTEYDSRRSALSWSAPTSTTIQRVIGLLLSCKATVGVVRPRRTSESAVSVMLQSLAIPLCWYRSWVTEVPPGGHTTLSNYKNLHDCDSICSYHEKKVSDEN